MFLGKRKSVLATRKAMKIRVYKYFPTINFVIHIDRCTFLTSTSTSAITMTISDLDVVDSLVDKKKNFSADS